MDRTTPSIWRLTKLADSSHEDRLTEALALVLHCESAATGLAHFLAEKAGFDWSAQTLDNVIPQCPLPGSQERVDLALENSTHRVWIEAKLDSGEGPDQLLRYARALSGWQRASSPGKDALLVYLTRQGGSERRVAELKRDEEFRATGVTALATDWQEIGKWVTDHGGQLGESFNHFLEMEHVLIQPISTSESEALEELDLLEKAARLRESWRQLLSGVRDQVGEAWEHADYCSWPKTKWDDCPKFNLNFAPKDQARDWPRDHSNGGPHAWLELRLPDPQTQLAFSYGLTLVDPDKTVQDSFDPEILDLVRRAIEHLPGETKLTQEEDSGRLARMELVRPVTDLQGGSLDQQIRDLSTWATEVFEAIPLDEVRPRSTVAGG